MSRFYGSLCISYNYGVFLGERERISTKIWRHSGSKVWVSKSSNLHKWHYLCT